jgi:hypothetical protein
MHSDKLSNAQEMTKDEECDATDDAMKYKSPAHKNQRITKKSS